jgi:hypothetical protein
MIKLEEILSKEIDKGWSEKEFNLMDLNDKRLDKRFKKVSEQISNKPQSPINQACETAKDTKAAYRLFANNKVTEEKIFLSHQCLTLERISKENLVLIIQDTSYLNFNSHKSKTGLGPIGNRCLQGLLMHSSLSITEAGLPLGLIDLKIWARDTNKKRLGKKELEQTPITEKESNKWLNSLENYMKLKPSGVRFITICDREADIYEFFNKAKDFDSEILVRAAQDRKLVGKDVGYLWEYLEKQDVKGKLEITIPKTKERKERKVLLEIKFATVILNPPGHLTKKEKEKSGYITIDAVLAREIKAPDDVEPLEWMLLTNVSVKTYEDAIERLNWYKRRWDIEVYHKVIKSGCKVEDCRLQSADRLIPYITLCSIIAWRLFWITKINRVSPDAPGTIILEEYELEALYVKTHRKKLPEDSVPTVREVVRWIAQLGGFLGRKGDKEPGITAIWRGWKELETISQMWLIMKSL